jgi:hypothetical protein
MANSMGMLVCILANTTLCRQLLSVSFMWIGLAVRRHGQLPKFVLVLGLSLALLMLLVCYFPRLKNMLDGRLDSQTRRWRQHSQVSHWLPTPPVSVMS